MEDVDVTFKWQIHPQVRRYSRNTHAPSIQDHTYWFKDSLDNKKREIWIFEVNNQPIGQLRLDRGEKNEISILISPQYAGRGYGGIALRNLCEQYLDLELWAYINLDNVASKATFERANFKYQYGNWYLLPARKPAP